MFICTVPVSSSITVMLKSISRNIEKPDKIYLFRCIIYNKLIEHHCSNRIGVQIETTVQHLVSVSRQAI